MRTNTVSLSLALPLAFLGASASAEQQPVAAASTRAGQGDAAEPYAAGTQDALFSAGAVDDATLRTVAGREDTTQVALNEQAAGVSRSSVGDNAVTGEARVDGNAFQNMSGLSILNVNTGNNVAINAAMTVNISIQSGP